MAWNNPEYLERKANIFGIDLNIPKNPIVSGGLRLDVGSTTLAVVSLLVVTTLYLTIRRRK